MDFLLSLVELVVERLRDFVIDRVLHTTHVDGNVRALDSQVEILRRKQLDVQDTINLEEPDGKVPTQEAEGWLKTAGELEEEAATINSKYEDRKCMVLGNCSFNCFLDYSIGVSAMEVKTKVENELQRIKDIQLTKYPPPSPVQEVPTATLGLETGSEIRLKVDMALEFLRHHKEGVFGIWGMGGVGKTTVLRHINNDLSKAKDLSLTFHRVVFITASRGCTNRKIQKLIAKELNLPEHGDHQTNIFNFLRNKNFLILLDDLWEGLDLEQAGVPPLGVFGELKHKIILTTRNYQVCLDMDARHLTVRVDCLTLEKGRLLFREKVGEEIINSLPFVQDLADKIADECNGLPIAIIAIARAMAGKNQVSLWKKAVNDLRASKHTTFSGKEGPLSLLKVSYDYLENSSLQECLLLCALWPEDFAIHVDEIIECWMGHGLLGEFNNMEEAYDKGIEIISNLHKGSLLEYSRECDKSLDISDNNGVVSLHDLIRDMALWIARDRGTNERKWSVLSHSNLQEAPEDKNLWKDAHKVMLMGNQLRKLPSNISAPDLITLILRENILNRVDFWINPNFHELKYLDISKNMLEVIPVEICRLYKLEYLNLSENYIGRLPEGLKDLKRLKYLLLKDNAMSEAPRELFSNLDSLEVLDLSSNFQVSQSSIIDNLDGLKGKLKALGINACSQLDLDKLNELSIPITSLGRYITEGERGTSFDLLLRPKHPCDPTWSNMRYLVVMGNDDGIRRLEELVIDESCGSFPKHLKVANHSHLKEIIWKGVKNKNASLNKLAHVDISSCHKLKHLNWLVNLPLLEFLIVECCNGMEHVIWGEEVSEVESDHVPSLPSTIFSSLRSLLLVNLQELKSICNRPISLPSLVHLNVFLCDSLKKLPFNTPASCSGLKKIVGDKEWWENTLELDDDVRTHLQYRSGVKISLR